MDALRRQQDRDVIAQGIAELEAGQGIPLAEALQAAAGRALGTQGMTFRVIILPQAHRHIRLKRGLVGRPSFRRTGGAVGRYGLCPDRDAGRFPGEQRPVCRER
jgi:hypothetical protein